MGKKRGMKTKTTNGRGDAGAEGGAGERILAMAASAGAGNALAVGAGLLFLGLCMALPLVGKAACGGSGSPGAGPMDTLGANKAFFIGLWLLTVLVVQAALGIKVRRWRMLGEPFPKAVAGLAGVLVALGLALSFGLLKL